MRTSVLLLVVLLSTACSSWFPKDNEPKPRPVPEFKPGVELDAVLSFGVDDAGHSLFQPLWLGGSVYATGVDGSVKVRSQKGESREFRFGERLSAGLDGNEQLLVAASASGRILAVKPDGTALWQREIKAGVLTRPRVLGDSVFVRSQDGRLLALSAADGQIRWQSEVKNPSLVLHVPNGMAFNESTVFAAFPGGRVRAYTRDEGKLLWDAWVAQPKGASELERITDVVGDPWLDGEQLCAVSFQGRIGCFEVVRGEPVWARDFSSDSGLAADHRHLYATAADGTLVAFDKASGRQAWKQDQLMGRKPTRPAILGKYVALADFEGKVYLLDGENGALVAIKDVGDAVRAPLVPADEGVVVQDEDGAVTVLRLR